MKNISVEIKETLNKQREFFYSNQTRDVSFRLKALKTLRKGIMENEALLLDALWKDLHKSEFEAYTSEIGQIYSEIGFHIRKIRRWLRPKRVGGSLVHFKSRHYIYSEPFGTALIMGPWNYPFLLIISPLIGSISGGNCTCLKPSPDAPHTALAIEKIIRDNFNQEYISIFIGGAEIYQALFKEKYDYIFFTGSPAIGKIVMTEAARNLTPVTLELGGKCPCIVDKDANIPLAAKRIVWGKFINAGQTCVAPDYLYVHKDIKDQLIECLKKCIEEAFGTDPKTNPDYCRIINEKHFLRLKSLIVTGNIIIGGDTEQESKYIAPTIIDSIDHDHPLMQDEIFGPVLPVLTFEDIDKVIQYINSKPKPLAFYCFSGNRRSQEMVLSRTSSGGACINDTIMHLANFKLPFGGVGDSGFGRYHGKFSFDTFTNKKAVLVKATWIDIPLRYLPPKNKLKLIKMIVPNKLGL